MSREDINRHCYGVWDDTPNTIESPDDLCKCGHKRKYHTSFKPHYCIGEQGKNEYGYPYGCACNSFELAGGENGTKKVD